MSRPEPDWVPLVIGRTIVAFEIAPDPEPDNEWSHGQNAVTIMLDDGSCLHFDAWGHDASGVTTTYTAGEADGQRCRRCDRVIQPYSGLIADLEVRTGAQIVVYCLDCLTELDRTTGGSV